MNWGFAIAGYVVTVVPLAIYFAWMLIKEHSLNKEVPQDRRKFLE